MKKLKLIIVSLLIVSLTFQPSISTTIKTEANSYDAPNGDIVSTRELALLASIAYENVPDDRNYVLSNSEKNAENDCFDAKGNFKKNNCFYKVIGNDDNKVRISGKNEYVLRYIEGMSDRKVRSLVSTVTASLKEDGEQYYFLNFAHAKELEDSGWKIYDYATQSKKTGLKELIQSIFKKDDISFEGTFDVVTFKKGSNYVLAYRGTDYPDLLEWIQDVTYAINGEHAEAVLAYNYAQQIYEEITKNDKNAKFYVTGHSLGAYLAQVGGAAIIDKEAGKTLSTKLEDQKQYNSLAEYKAEYYKGTPSRLQQVAYFNGMGIDGVAVTNAFSVQMQNALVYLSTHDKNGNINTTNRNVNYSNNIKSSGRLVLYSMDGDPISSVGFHFGEIYKLETAADAITNHRYTHTYGNWVDKLEPGKFLANLLSTLNNVLNKVTSGKAAQTLTETLKNMIVTDHSTGSTVLNYLPEYVIKSIEAETGRPITNYGLGSLLENLATDLENYTSAHGMTNLFDHFNVNHETDSFACIIDQGKGKIADKDIKLSISSVGLNCNNSTGICTTSKTYNDNKITYNDLTVTGNYQGNNIMLTASIDSACAKRYIWEYSTDNSKWNTIGTTIDNKIILPAERFNNANAGDGIISYFFRVKVAYGDTFTELKATFPENSTITKYQRTSNIYSANPTISEGLNVEITNTNISSKKKATAISKKVTLITDSTGPTCEFKPKETNPTEAKLKCFLGICRNQTLTATFECKDEYNEIDTNITKNMFKTADTGLIDSVKIKEVSSKSSDDKKTVTVTIVVEATRVPTSKKPKVVFNNEVKDSKGNSSKINQSLEIKISKK